MRTSLASSLAMLSRQSLLTSLRGSLGCVFKLSDQCNISTAAQTPQTPVAVVLTWSSPPKQETSKAPSSPRIKSAEVAEASFAKPRLSAYYINLKAAAAVRQQTRAILAAAKKQTDLRTRLVAAKAQKRSTDAAAAAKAKAATKAKSALTAQHAAVKAKEKQDTMDRVSSEKLVAAKAKAKAGIRVTALRASRAKALQKAKVRTQVSWETWSSNFEGLLTTTNCEDTCSAVTWSTSVLFSKQLSDSADANLGL